MGPKPGTGQLEPAGRRCSTSHFKHVGSGPGQPASGQQPASRPTSFLGAAHLGMVARQNPPAGAHRLDDAARPGPPAHARCEREGSKGDDEVTLRHIAASGCRRQQPTGQVDSSGQAPTHSWRRCLRICRPGSAQRPVDDISILKSQQSATNGRQTGGQKAARRRSEAVGGRRRKGGDAV